MATASDINSNKDLLKDRQKKLNIVLLFTLGLVVTINTIFMIGVISNTSEDSNGKKGYYKWLRIEHNFVIAMFTLFLLTYLTVLYMLTRVKKFFPQFNQREYKHMAIASFSIIFLDTCTNQL